MTLAQRFSGTVSIASVGATDPCLYGCIAGIGAAAVVTISISIFHNANYGWETLRGIRLVDDAGRTMDEVVDSVGRVTHIMSEITAASQEQGAGIAQINDAIIQMDQVTQQNAALVEQAAAAAAALKELAANLTRVVGVFKLNDSDNLLTVAAPGPVALAGDAMRRRWLPAA